MWCTTRISPWSCSLFRLQFSRCLNYSVIWNLCALLISYADETQLYDAFKPGQNEDVVLHKLKTYIGEIRKWMKKNKLKLNYHKTGFIVFGTVSALKQVKTSSIQIGDHVTHLPSCVRNIVGYFDSTMMMNEQVWPMCKSTWYHLYQIREVQSYLTEDHCKTLEHAYATPKLDTNNGLLYGVYKYLICKLQLVQICSSTSNLWFNKIWLCNGNAIPSTLASS